MFRFTTAGESHGRALVAIVEGLPAGLPIDIEQINHELHRRQKGYGRGARMKIEQDRAEIISGVRHGLTLGSPLAVMIENKDWANWDDVMSPGERELAPEKPLELTFDQIKTIPEDAPLRCADKDAQQRMIDLIDQKKREGDTLGGIFEVVARGVVPGLGSYTAWDLKLDGRLAQAVMSIPAVKAVASGAGTEASSLPGSEVHDEIGYNDETKEFIRAKNRAGGLEGGVTNGEEIRVRGHLKPISTLRRALRSVDIDTKQEERAAFERSDITVVPAAGIIGEAMVALVLATAMREKFGGDSLGEMKRNFEGYREQLRGY